MKFEAREIWDVMFRFPYVLVIKGGYEVIHINMVKKHYTYFQLPGCLVAIGSHSPNEFRY